ncbi:hypothetical protein V500_00452 [Pseudogymnoascus sp. VKM F-4518 (FW-2643)]|nr:hypothetical protein V500_00452 [Pseudogymnoascus sp. VKM F-4518 (FW-2643)]
MASKSEFELQNPQTPSTASEVSLLDKIPLLPVPAYLPPATSGAWNGSCDVLMLDACCHPNPFPITGRGCGLRFTPKTLDNRCEVSMGRFRCYTSREAIEATFAGRWSLSESSSWAALTYVKANTSVEEDRRNRKRENDRKAQQNKRHRQKEYICSLREDIYYLQEERDSLLEDRIELSKRNKQLEDEKAQLERRLSMLEREGMVQNYTLDYEIARMNWVAPDSYPFIVMASDSATNERTH